MPRKPMAGISCKTLASRSVYTIGNNSTQLDDLLECSDGLGHLGSHLVRTLYCMSEVVALP